MNQHQAKRKISMCMAAITMISGILTACSTSVDASPVPTTNNSISLIDIEGHWATSAIQQAIRNGYVDGYEDQTFKPDQVLSRAEFTKMTVTALKLPVSGSTSGKDWYLPYVNAAVSAGIHKWSDINTGDWNTPMTRYEMARMASRAVGQATEDEKQWMYLAAKAGLIQGMDETGTLAEEGTTTRAQSVTIIERILDVKSGKELPVDKHALNRAEVVWHKTNIFTVMPQYFGKIHPSSKWDPDDLFIESGDGNYRGELDALLAIDLQDPNDPFLGEVPQVETLRWYNSESSKTSPYIQPGMAAYLLVYQGREVYNYDPSVYVHKDWVPLSISGQMVYDYDAFYKGTLTGLSTIFQQKRGDMGAYIIPKKLKTRKYLKLELYTPNVVGYQDHYKTILWSVTPEWIE